MTPSWYDVLDVAPEASTEEIRAAWQAAVAGLDPTDRRFKLANRAAETLLDPERRAAHDAELAAEEPEDIEVIAHESSEPVEPVEEPAPSPASTIFTDVGPGEPAVTQPPPASSPPPPARAASGTSTADWLWGAVVAGALAVVLLVVTVLAVVHTRDDEGGGGHSASADSVVTGRDAEDAREAAVQAIKPVLSYDYRHLDDSREAAIGYLTDDYRTQYEDYFDRGVAPNAPNTETIVSVEVVDSAIALTGPDLVDVLLFVNRPTSNKDHPPAKPVIYHDQVTARMQKVDGVWLLGCLITTGGDACGD